MKSVFLRTKNPFHYTLKLLLLFILYVTTGLLGLTIHPVGGFATYVWLPSGISLAALILCGFELWPAIFLGALVVNFITGANPLVAVGIGIGNTLETVIANAMLTSRKFDYALGKLRDVILFVFLALPVGSFVSASIGALSLFAGSIVTPDAFFTTWQAWFIGDLISMIIVTPFLITWFSSEPYHFLVRPRGLEALLLLATTTFVGFSVFHGTLGGIFSNSPRTYLVFPPLIWAALRFGPRAVATNILILSLAAITGILVGVGPFTSTSLAHGLLTMQIFMGVLAVTGLILAGVDTERKAYEMRKDEFIGLVSHELKTPLTSLKVFTQMLEKSFTNTKKKVEVRYLQKMDSEIDRLNALISDLLDITKMRSGTINFSKEYVACISCIQSAIEIIQPTTSHYIVFRYAKKDQNTLIYADKERLQQVCINLLTNAIKYSPPNKKIIVSVNFEKRFVIVSVKDFGIGIPPEDTRRIFERYFRATNENNLTYPGLGLGLYVSYEIVKQHSGKMWVESAKGKGATFFVRLPHTKGSTSFLQKGFFLRKSG